MFAEPSCCGGFREWELIKIGIKMAARYQGEPFRFQCALVSRKRQIGDSHLVVACDNHQQRRRRNAGDPDAGLIHARGPRRAQRYLVFPEAFRNGLKIEIDRINWSAPGSDTCAL
jgi:hypothetical protein